MFYLDSISASLLAKSILWFWLYLHLGCPQVKGPLRIGWIDLINLKNAGLFLAISQLVWSNAVIICQVGY